MIQIVHKPLSRVFSDMHHMIMQVFEKANAKAVQEIMHDQLSQQNIHLLRRQTVSAVFLEEAG